ncbi:MAG TPA: IgGFc-binding protein [Polyangiaceae bacterium]|jgi:hypothetical protein
MAAVIGVRARLVVSFVSLGAAVLWAGCGSGSKGTSFAPPDGGTTGADGSSSGGGGSDAAQSGDAHALFGDGATGDAAPGCTTCSSDLHQILDCATPPHVVSTCPDDQGCGTNGQCVAPCDAAVANKSSIGCDYYSIPADGWSNIPINPEVALEGASDGSCFAAFVTNTWGTPMTVSLEFAGTTIDAAPHAYIPQGSGASLTYAPVPSTGIPAGKMAIVFLSQYGTTAGAFKVLCPASVTPAFTTSDVGLHGTGVGNAVHIITSAPSVVYDIYPYGGAKSYISSATLLLPTNVWDTNYVAIAAAVPEPTTAGATTGLPMDVEVVGMQDGTKVTILPTAAIAAGGTVPASAANTQATFTLNKGQLLQFAQLGDLSGSPIQASAPVGVWGGHYCMNLPTQTTSACDAAHQQIPPVKAAGNEYVAVRYRSRTGSDESVPWRIMGFVAGTTLTYDPPQTGAPPTLGVGQVVEFEAPGPFDVKSQDAQHPFYLAAHMTGGELAGGLGDPETVNVTPPAQYLAKYVFFTDPTYSDTNLVLVQGKDATGAYPPVMLECLPSALTGWQPVGASGYQYTRIDVQLSGAPVGGCDNGLHTITSTAPFGITVWGFDQYVSYAYPAGASVRPINNVVVPPNPQ